MAPLPSFAPFPQTAWRQHLTSSEWNTLLEAWLTLSKAWLEQPQESLTQSLTNNDSVVVFLQSLMEEVSQGGPDILASQSLQLTKAVYHLTSRILTTHPPSPLLTYEFLSDFSRIYPKKRVAPIISQLFSQHGAALEPSILSLKKQLIPQLEAGIKGDLRIVESRLSRLNHILHVSPESCALFLAGSDFFDGLVTCFRVMNPPLRKIIITTMFLCLLGLTEYRPPKWAMLSDQLYALKAAADAHKQGPTNANDSLVPELVTSTPILNTLLQRLVSSGTSNDNLKKRLAALEGFKKGPMSRPKRLVRRKVDKGKGREIVEKTEADIHIHQMSQITQIQDLFPDLGAGFIAKCLDEYGDEVELVVANLLGESLPAHLANADRTETLSHQAPPSRGTHQSPTTQHATPLPSRRNVFDDDELDRLAVDTAKLSFGKRPGKSADDMLQDKSSAPSKAAILSALAAFDSDEDERDDTYDAADVGGTVDATNQEADGVNEGLEEVLYRAYQMDPKTFDRNAEVRRGKVRGALRTETGMTDESIEGWAVMLARNPQQKRRLEARYAFAGEQVRLERTSWNAEVVGSGAEDSDRNEASRGGRGGRGGRGRGRGGRGRGGGDVAGSPADKDTEQARRRKEANKGSRANHNRREGRARKMARGGFPG
jgi:activating signal cointegrator complex subunit 2